MIETILPPHSICTESLLSDSDCEPPMSSFGEGRTLYHFEPSDYDVICSAHRQNNQFRNHAGNLAFQAIIDENLYGYTTAKSQLTKAAIVSNIVETIQKRSPHGGFVEQVAGQWFEIGTWNARERVLQALQDAVTCEQSEEPANDANVRLDILVSSCQFGPTSNKRTISGTFEKRVSGSLLLDVPMGNLNWEILNELKREVFIVQQSPTKVGMVLECRSPPVTPARKSNAYKNLMLHKDNFENLRLNAT